MYRPVRDGRIEFASRGGVDDTRETTRRSTFLKRPPASLAALEPLVFHARAGREITRPSRVSRPSSFARPSVALIHTIRGIAGSSSARKAGPTSARASPIGSVDAEIV